MSKAKKLLSVLLAVALLMTTVSVAFTAFAADVDSVIASIDGYKGNGKLTSKKSDPAFKPIADEYAQLTSAQKEELGMDRVIKMTGNAYNYISVEYTIPDGTPEEEKAKGKDYLMWKAIDDLIGYTDAQDDAFKVVPYVVGNVAFTPAGESLSVAFNKLTFDETAQGQANVAGLKEMRNLYNDASELAKQYMDYPYYKSGYFYQYNYAYYYFQTTKSLLNAEYNYQCSLMDIPDIEKPTAPEAPAMSKEEEDMIAEIEALKQQRKDEGKTVVADQELYRKMMNLQSKLNEYRRTTKAQSFTGEEYSKYIDALKKYEQDYRDYYYDYATKYIEVPYAKALAAVNMPKAYKDALKTGDKLADAILAFEADPTKISAVTTAAGEFLNQTEAMGKFLSKCTVSNAAAKFSTTVETTSKTGLQPLDTSTLTSMAKSFNDAEKTNVYQDFIKNLNATGFTMTNEQASALYQQYGSTDFQLKKFLNADQAAKYEMVKTYGALGDYYSAPNQEKPTAEMESFKPADVKYNFGVSESRMEDIAGVLNTTVLDLMKSSGYGKEEIYKLIFTNANLAQLMLTIMPLLEEAAAGMSGLEGSIFKGAIKPATIAKNLKETDYQQANDAMKKLSNWTTPTEEQKAEYLAASYGFEDGDAQAFVQAFSAHLRNLWSLLSMAGIKLEDTFNSDGSLKTQGLYSATVVPLFDAIGLKNYPSPMDFATRMEMENAANSTKDAALLNILEPLVGLVDQILESPVSELLSLLPNLIYQLDSGKLGSILAGAFDNLGSIGSGIDPSVKEMLKNLNSEVLYDPINNFLQQGIQIPAIEGLTTQACTLKLHFSKELWNQFTADLAHCGTATAASSKSVDNAYVFRVEANKADVLVTAANFALNAVKENRADWQANFGNLNEIEKLLMGATTMSNEMLLGTIFNAVLPEADYSAVNEAVASIPDDLSLYTDESAAKVQEAKDAIVYGLSTQRQEEVDAMAKALKDAVKALEKKPENPTNPTDPTDPTNPTDPSKPNEGNGNGSGDANLPTTGDKLLAIAGVAVIGAAAAFLLSKKKKED